MKLFSVSHKTELASCHNSCVILMTMLSCKLKNCIILLQFVILLNVLEIKKSETCLTAKSFNTKYFPIFYGDFSYLVDTVTAWFRVARSLHALREAN